jgi:hypothetical protein
MSGGPPTYTVTFQARGTDPEQGLRAIRGTLKLALRIVQPRAGMGPRPEKGQPLPQHGPAQGAQEGANAPARLSCLTHIITGPSCRTCATEPRRRDAFMANVSVIASYILTLPPIPGCLSSSERSYDWVGVCPRVVARESALRSSSTRYGHDGW